MFSLQNIEEMMGYGRTDEAAVQLDAYIEVHTNDDKVYFLRGKLMWRMGKRRQAMSDYAHAISINPESPARQALEQAHDIMAFFNTDLMNP